MNTVSLQSPEIALPAPSAEGFTGYPTRGMLIEGARARVRQVLKRLGPRTTSAVWVMMRPRQAAQIGWNLREGVRVC